MTGIMIPILAFMVGGGSLAPDSLSLAQAGPEPTPYDVITSPPVAGFRFGLDGEVATTDEQGVARFLTTTRENMRNRLTAIDTEVFTDDGKRRLRFNSFQRFSSTSVGASFNVDYLVEFTFVDNYARPVVGTLIDSMELRASTGQTIQVYSDEPVWLHGVRVLANNEPRQIYWTVQAVSVRGASVAQRSAFRITPDIEQHLQIGLLMFDLEISVRSKILNRAVGDSIALRHPDNRETTHNLVDGALTIEALPRGTYAILIDGPGVSVRRTITVTRHQVVDLEFFTYFDLSVTVLLTALFLMFPFIARRIRRRRRRARLASARLAR